MFFVRRLFTRRIRTLHCNDFDNLCAENEFAKAKFSVGDSVAFTCKKRGTIVGNITKVKLKRANVMTTTGSWDVPLTMLEVA